MGQNLDEGKKKCSISILSFSPSCKHDYDFFNISYGRSLNIRIPMSYLNFFNVVEDNAFVNRSTRLLHDRTFYESSFNLCNTNNIIFV